MKQNKNLFFKSLVAIILSGAILMSGMLLIGASGVETKDLDDSLLSPDVTEIVEKDSDVYADIKAEKVLSNGESSDESYEPIETCPVYDFEIPASQDSLDGKFDAYNSVSEENGLSVVTVYSPELVSDLASRRANGEWFKLTEEEILYLIRDAKELLSEYDIVRVYNLDGSVNEYYGEGYYYSDAYYDSFGVAPENQSSRFNVEIDSHYVALDRITVLHSAIAKEWKDPSPRTVIMTGIDGYPEPGYYMDDGVRYDRSSEEELQVMASTVAMHYRQYGDSSRNYPYDFSAFIFYDEYNGKNVFGYITPDGTSYNLSGDIDYRGASKYDYLGTEKAITIEVWDEATDTIAARLRLENDTDAEVIADIENLWVELETFLHSDEYEKLSTDYYFTETDYSVVVYYQGEDSDKFVCPIYHYKPDGNLNEWSYSAYPRIICCLDGAQNINAYINALLSERLLGE